MTTATSSRDRLHAVIDDLLTKKRIDRPKFFQALDIVHEIARDCSEQCDRLQRENAVLHQNNNQLAWLVISQAHAITGKLKEHHT